MGRRTLRLIRLFWVLALVCSAGLAAPVRAAPLSFNWDITNETGAAARDFHVTIVSDKALTHRRSFNGAFGNPTITRQAGGLVHDVTWAGGTVANGARTHVGLEFEGELGARVSVINIRWTDANGRQQGRPVEQPSFPGFRARPLFGFSMNNTRNEDNPETPEDEAAESPNLRISDLHFVINPTKTPLENLMAGLLTGIPELPFDIAVDSEFTGPFSGLPSLLPETGFLVMEGVSSYDGGAGLIRNVFLMQAGLAIPEPSSLAAFLAAAAVLRARYRKRSMDPHPARADRGDKERIPCLREQASLPRA